MAEATKGGRIVISMKDDWKRIFPFLRSRPDSSVLSLAARGLIRYRIPTLPLPGRELGLGAATHRLDRDSSRPGPRTSLYRGRQSTA
jgi:hypothetical protein